MFRNIGSQKIVAQLVAKTDGSDVTSGTTTVYVSKDGAAQASSGTATHLGNGCWVHTPAQASTDGAHLAFTFVNTAAVSVSLQIYTVDWEASVALNNSAKSIGYGTAGVGCTSTSVFCSYIQIAGSGGSASVGANALAGRVLIFRGDTASSGLRGAGARITANSSGGTPTLTLNSADALPATPASGDLFAIL